MSLSTHVLDTSRGRPAHDVPVALASLRDGAWVDVASGATDADGRHRFADPPGAGVWRLTFDTGTWFAAQGVTGFYPSVPVVFEITSPEQHHHVPLLISPFGYSTYRGS